MLVYERGTGLTDTRLVAHIGFHPGTVNPLERDIPRTGHPVYSWTYKVDFLAEK